MSDYTRSSNEINKYDLHRIVEKSTMIQKIIDWLTYLLTIDKTVNKNEVVEAIEMLSKKKNVLDEKFKNASTIMAEEADLLFCAFEDFEGD